MPRKTKKQKTDEEAKKKKKKWADSRARLRILDDLDDNSLPLYKKELSAEDTWNLVYKDLPEFSEVEFERFRDRLRDHRRQVIKRKNKCSMELEAYLHDRNLYPRQEIDRDGCTVFDISAAKKLLEQDVKEKKHLSMSRAALQASREEYMEYPAHKFKERIYQAVKREKFINYLEDKRSKDRHTTW